MESREVSFARLLTVPFFRKPYQPSFFRYTDHSRCHGELRLDRFIQWHQWQKGRKLIEASLKTKRSLHLVAFTSVNILCSSHAASFSGSILHALQYPIFRVCGRAGVGVSQSTRSVSVLLVSNSVGLFCMSVAARRGVDVLRCIYILTRSLQSSWGQG